eukprot:1408369-Pyramimonas_sp.AAC.1
MFASPFRLALNRDARSCLVSLGLQHISAVALAIYHALQADIHKRRAQSACLKLRPHAASAGRARGFARCRRRHRADDGRAAGAPGGEDVAAH